MRPELGGKRFRVEDQREWRRWVTPKPLADKPIHRWYIFPHSFTSELVQELISEWGLTRRDRILDPFVGAGTTLLAAKEMGIPATGYDLSPLAVLTTQAKVANYSESHLRTTWNNLCHRLKSKRWKGSTAGYPDLVRRALPGDLLAAFDAAGREIASLSCSAAEKRFLRLALLRNVPKFSRAVATGGWLKWVDTRTRASSLPSALEEAVEQMLQDVAHSRLPRLGAWAARLGDARALPDRKGTYSAVITSPPYPNRHDYTRVFGVELMLEFLDWQQMRQLRYQSFHSHPEAHPNRPDHDGYRRPSALVSAVKRIRERTKEPRLAPMLNGFFLDMFLCLREIARVCRSGARVAVVVGNARYCNQAVPVDELTAIIGERVGLKCDRLIAARYRGNSAQQMGLYGRRRSRESVLIFHKV